MVRAFISSYDEYVGEEEEETARTKKGKNILMARRREQCCASSRTVRTVRNSYIWVRNSYGLIGTVTEYINRFQAL